MRPNRKQKQAGQVLVESALSMILYLGIVFATFNLAIILFVFQSYSDRARHALRVASVPTYDAGTTPATIQNLILFGQSTVPGGTANANTGFMGLQRSNISVIPNINGSNNASSRITVQIANFSYSTFAFAMFGGSTSGTGRTIEVSLPYEQ
jgi:hypothetical protein